MRLRVCRASAACSSVLSLEHCERYRVRGGWLIPMDHPENTAPFLLHNNDNNAKRTNYIDVAKIEHPIDHEHDKDKKLM